MTRSSSAMSARGRKAGEPMPTAMEPMLAVLSELPRDEGAYSYEFKWDGVRAICFWDGSRLRLQSRNLIDITARYPELHSLGEALGGRRAILDGEIIALDELDRPSFGRLQRRMHVLDQRAVARLVREVPVYYIVFDLLYLERRSTMELPWTERRRLLEELTLAGSAWRVSPAVRDGRTMLEAARASNLEGIVAKRLESVYEPGRRSPAWRKVKIVQRQEFVVGGWTAEKGGGRGRIGSLLVGYYAPGARERGGSKDEALHYAGSVGTGLKHATHRELMELLEKRQRSGSPFAEKVAKAGVVFVEPEIVVEVEFRRWPEGGLIQQAAFKGVRRDKRAREVVKEERVCDATGKDSN